MREGTLEYSYETESSAMLDITSNTKHLLNTSLVILQVIDIDFEGTIS